MEKMISVYWFVILILVAVGVSSMVFAFYSNPYDVREAEANFLMEKVADCFVTGGKINDYVFQDDLDFLGKCGLIFDVEPELEKGQYYFEVEITDLVGISGLTIKQGNPGIKTHCEPQEEEEFQKLSKCVEGSFYALDSSGDQKIVNILTVVRKTQKNVK